MPGLHWGPAGGRLYRLLPETPPSPNQSPDHTRGFTLVYCGGLARLRTVHAQAIMRAG